MKYTYQNITGATRLSGGRSSNLVIDGSVVRPNQVRVFTIPTDDIVCGMLDGTLLVKDANGREIHDVNGFLGLRLVQQPKNFVTYHKGTKHVMTKNVWVAHFESSYVEPEPEPVEEPAAEEPVEEVASEEVAAEEPVVVVSGPVHLEVKKEAEVVDVTSADMTVTEAKQYLEDNPDTDIEAFLDGETRKTLLKLLD